MGARKLIEKLEVSLQTKSGKITEIEVKITPINHLSFPPIIEAIDLNYFSQESHRGSGDKWVHKLQRVFATNHTNQTPQFRLEIIQ